MTKKTLGFSVILLALCFGVYALTANASTVTGDLSTGLNTNAGSMDGVVIAMPTLSPAAGTYTSAQTITLTAAGSTKICYTTDGSTEPSCATATACTAGTTLSNGGSISVSSTTTVKSAACYNNNSTGPVATSAYTINIPSSSSGGGGGGSSTTYCSSVTYADWATTCFNNIQYRSVSASTPSGCTMTSAQQLAAQRTCPTAVTATVVTTPETTTTTTVTTGSGSDLITTITNEAGVLNTGDTNQLLGQTGGAVNTAGEQAGLTKYKTIIGSDKALTAGEKSTLNDFIVYGTPTTQRLGAGERAAVLNSYFQAYGKSSNSETEWSDVLKIASGRWPSERNAAAEAQAKLEFKKVYARNAVLTNNVDQNAIMVIAYGLLPLNRNLASENTAIKTFKKIYGHAPSSALAWNVVRAIAYSGAKR